MKEIKDNTNKRIIYTHGVEELILLKWLYYPKQSTDECNPYQNSNDIFHKTRTNNIKIYMDPQKTQIAKMILRKKNEVGSITLLDFKLYYKILVIKTV